MKATLNMNDSSVWPPLPTMAELIAVEVEKMDYVTSITLLDGFDHTVNGVVYHFSTNTSDQANFVKQMADCNFSMQLGLMTPEQRTAMYPDGLPTALPEDQRIYWRGHKADGTADTLEFTMSGFLGLCKAFSDATRGALAAGWEIKARMAACQTKQELAAVCEDVKLEERYRAANELAAEKKYIVV